METETAVAIAAATREACLAAAKQAYEDAAMSGLCEEGALEVALGAIHQLDLNALVAELQVREATEPPTPSRKR